MKILAEKFEYFSKKIEKLSKKSKKILGSDITFEIKNSYIKEVKDGNNTAFVKMLDIEVEIPEIKIEGWTPMLPLIIQMKMATLFTISNVLMKKLFNIEQLHQTVIIAKESVIGILLSFFNMMMDKKFRLGKLV